MYMYKLYLTPYSICYIQYPHIREDSPSIISSLHHQ